MLRKIHKYDLRNDGIFSGILIYLICGIITSIFANKGGIIIGSGELSISSEISSEAIVVPFVIVFFILQLIYPILIAIYLYFRYSKAFSDKEILSRIIPTSNKNKIGEILRNAVLAYGAFFVITVIENYMGDSELGTLGLILITAALTAIIVDIFCRESRLSENAKYIWCIIGAMAIAGSLNIISDILEAAEYSNVIINVLAIVCCAVEGLYIMKKADTIKIG